MLLATRIIASTSVPCWKLGHGLGHGVHSWRGDLFDLLRRDGRVLVLQHPAVEAFQDVDHVVEGVPLIGPPFLRQGRGAADDGQATVQVPRRVLRVRPDELPPGLEHEDELVRSADGDPLLPHEFVHELLDEEDVLAGEQSRGDPVLQGVGSVLELYVVERHIGSRGTLSWFPPAGHTHLMRVQGIYTCNCRGEFLG